MFNDTPPPSPRMEEDEDDGDEEEMIYVGDLEDFDSDPDADLDDVECRYFEAPRDDSVQTFYSDVLETSLKPVYCGNFSPDGAEVVLGGKNDAGIVFATNSLDPIFSIKHEDSVTSAEYSFDNKYLATGDMSGYIQVFLRKLSINPDTRDGFEPIFDSKIGDMCWMFWHKAAHIILAGTRVGQIYIFKIPSGNCKVLQGHGSATDCGVLMSDCRRVAAGYADGSVKIWDIKTGIAQHTIQVTDNESVIYLDTHTDNNLILTGGSEGAVRLVGNGRVLSHLTQEESCIESVVFSPDSELNLAATATLDGEIAVWDIAKSALRHTLQASDKLVGITRLKWLSAARLVSANMHGHVHIFNALSGTLEKTFYGHTTTILDLAISKDGNFILATAQDGTGRIYDMNKPNVDVVGENV